MISSETRSAKRSRRTSSNRSTSASATDFGTRSSGRRSTRTHSQASGSGCTPPSRRRWNWKVAICPTIRSSRLSSPTTGWRRRIDDRALAASLVAGDGAVRQLAYAEGLEHYERVLDLWGKGSEPPVGLSLAEVLVRASHVAWNAGEPEKTVALGRRALEELGETGDRVLRVRALDEVARALDDIGRFGEATPYEQLLSDIEVEGLPLLEQLIVLDYRVQTLRWQGDRAAATAAALDAVRFADGTDDPELMGDAHGLIAWISLRVAGNRGGHRRGNPRPRLRLERRRRRDGILRTQHHVPGAHGRRAVRDGDRCGAGGTHPR